MLDIWLEHIDTISDTEVGYELISHFITLNGDAVYLHKKESKPDTLETIGQQYKVLRHTKGQVEETFLPPLKMMTHLDPIIDFFSDGSLLIADRRCQYRGVDDYDLNGMIYNPKTKEIRQFLAGDGIEQAQIDHNDNIWISYFDEGTIGNYGWGNVNARPLADPIGKTGLNCFDSLGNIIWKFDQADAFIDDCYAMNVTPQDTHIYYYSDFDFCTISENYQTSFFSPKLGGCETFAISGKYLLFDGQYEGDICKAYLIKKAGESFNSPIPVNLKLSHGEAFSEGTLIGRGNKLHLFTKTDWFAIDAREAFEQADAV
ncbi:hypothetical protein [Kiloniella antarctica]|uniref:SMP-30/Gluconolactonase/LRE-like region domain-containing protein n=1 Tax=Kiloniella antarctica TaxID=1550907 RepID=A0ABW5BHA3_9PROT